jgi:hypothetical protein
MSRLVVRTTVTLGAKKPAKRWFRLTDTLHMVAALACESAGHTAPAGASPPCGDCLRDMVARSLSAAAAGKFKAVRS